MNYKNRALKSIIRRKGKSLILFGVLVILGNLIAGAIAIQQATGNVEKNIKSRLGAKASFELDFNKFSKEQNANSSLPKGPSLNLIKKAGQLPYVKKYDYNVNTYLTTDKLKTYQPEQEDNSQVAVYSGSPDLLLKGVNYAPLLDLEEKKAKLVEGRTFTQEEVDKGKAVGLVSKKFAELNNLHVGDKMIVDNTVYSLDQSGNRSETPDATKDFALDIIGIFEPVQSTKKASGESGNDTKQMMKEFYQTAYLNTIYVPNKISYEENRFSTKEMAKSQGLSEEEATEEAKLSNAYTPVFILKSPEDSERFKEEMSPLMPKYYQVKTSTDQYDSIAAPVKTMAKLSRYVLIASIGASLLIITLIILLFLRERKHEFGIYLSLGEKRVRIIGQMLIEVILVAIVAITLSVFTGNFLAKGISSNMMQADTEQNMTSNQNLVIGMNESEIENDISESDVTNAYQINLSPSFIIVFYLVGISTILISTILPLFYILKLNPKKIMM